MTLPITHNNETILLEKYPEEWLDQDAETSNAEFLFSTNKQVLQSGNIPDDFINPYDNPECLTEIRQSERMSPKKWRDCVKETWPGIDAQAEYKLRKEEVKQERMAQCGERRYRKNLYRPGETIEDTWHCNQRECPKCRLKKIDNIKNKIKDAAGMNCYRFTQEQEKSLNLDKSQYLRIPDDSTGETYYVMNCDTNFDCLETLKIDKSLIERLSEMAVDCKRRVSGTLLGKLSSSTSSEKNNDNQTEVIEEISYREYKLEFGEDSKVEGYKDIDRIVLEQLDLEHLQKTYTHDFLQAIIYTLEENTKKVCKDACVKIHFISKKQSLVNIEKVDWSLLQRFNKL